MTSLMEQEPYLIVLSHSFQSTVAMDDHEFETHGLLRFHDGFLYFTTIKLSKTIFLENHQLFHNKIIDLFLFILTEVGLVAMKWSVYPTCASALEPFNPSQRNHNVELFTPV